MGKKNCIVFVCVLVVLAQYLMNNKTQKETTDCDSTTCGVSSVQDGRHSTHHWLQLS